MVNDAEYRAFVEKYGHLDFHLLKFLPKIKTKWELDLNKDREAARRQWERQNHIVTKNCERMARYQKNSTLGEIREEVDETESSVNSSMKK